MNEKEALNLVGLALANFPSLQERDMRPTAVLWLKVLKDIPYQTAEKALVYVLSTAKYFPTVAEIREAVIKISAPDMPTPMEAWGQVMDAIRKYDPYENNGNPASPYKNMHSLVAKITKAIGWYELRTCENIGVMRAHFIKAYEIEMKRAQERALIGNLVQLPTGNKLKKLKA